MKVRVGFMPLIDASPVLVAAELGFVQREGLQLELVRETSWATLRDRMSVGHLDAAHMLAPMPIAANLGLGPLPMALVAPMALGFGGNTITVSDELWAALAAEGAGTSFEAAAAGKALARVVEARRRRSQDRIVLAIVHPHSAHHYQVAFWLGASGLVPGRDVELVIVPPPLTAAALEGGQVDAFCAGEPWGSIAVRRHAGKILTTTAHIWRSSPEKVLGVRTDWFSADEERTRALVRAVHAAAHWCDDPANRTKLAELLSQPHLLDNEPAALLASLGRRLVAADGTERPVDGFLTFAANAATFPWTSHALWFFTQMVRWGQAPYTPENLARARQTYRADIYRGALADAGIALPSASSKVEGAVLRDTPVGSPSGRLTLGADAFFDGSIFDPDHIDAYVSAYRIEPDRSRTDSAARSEG
ncbi:MAG: CmpA/NrtA family ABC transporter substrate-binding protein [Hyphomicrobiaceae bacterium]